MTTNNKLEKSVLLNPNANIAYVLMVVSCVLMSWTIIPLAWMIPMVLMYKKRINNYKNSSALAICTILFCGPIFLCIPAAILLLILKEEDYKLIEDEN